MTYRATMSFFSPHFDLYAEYDCDICDDLSKNNATGFNALPAGMEQAVGMTPYWPYLGESSYFWTASANQYGDPYEVNLQHDFTIFLTDNSINDHYGFSVRCVRDE